MFFSDHYEIKKSQDKLDFVDIILERDIPVFLDPFRLKVDNSPIAYNCRKLIVNFFDLLIKTIRDKKKNKALELLDMCHEANEVHFGYSNGNGNGNPEGAGIGEKQAKDLYNRLLKSKAADTGNLKDLEDCALLVEGIRNDKISDIVVNVIRKELISFTIFQCKKHKIKNLEMVNMHYWSYNKRKWESESVKLPFYNNKPIILVPKSFVGQRLVINIDAYYRFGFLPHKQQEHLEDPRLGLVQIVKGEMKPPTKKDLEKVYPKSKEKLVEFTDSNPDEICKFRSYMEEKIRKQGVGDIDDALGRIKERVLKKNKKK